MAHYLNWLHGCKSTQLKAIARAVGVNSSGTKSLLTTQLERHLPHGHDKGNATTASPSKKHDIISIDMGIRNLAYCRIIVPCSSSSAKASGDEIPVISEWARIEIAKQANKAKNPKELKTKEVFDPATYSQYAFNLVTTLLSGSPNRPTDILIERQRFRSMGGSAVQEWTLRVNMFEAMIYAVLKTLAEKGAWQGNVFPVAPAKVSKFWLGEKEGSDEVGGGGSKSAKTKTAKVQLVGRWLEERCAGGLPLDLRGKAKEIGTAYQEKRNGKRDRKPIVEVVGGSSDGAAVSAELGKLDDLADCLLQGVAWIKWEKNRKLILSNGIDALCQVT
ncbi:hypothetical protein ACLMJK_007203 [Lecanora helva]